MSIRKLVKLFAPAAALAAFSAPVVAAPSLDSLDLDPATKNALRGLISAPAITPAAAFGSPIAYGSNWGDVFAAIGGTELPAGAREDVDGGAVIGFGLGDAAQTIGVEFSWSAIGLRDDFGADGAFNVKLHTLLPGDVGIAAGLQNFEAYGDADGTPASTYVAATKAWALNAGNPSNPLTLITNVGVGDNGFDDNGDIGAFGSLALYVTRQIGLVADWSGEQLNAGVSLVPIRALPVSVTVGASNITEENGGEVQFGGSLGFAFNFLN